MSFATTRDNVRLHYEEVGTGTPIVFVHEFAGDWRAWEPQMRYFARRYRCVTFSFRGYHPSDVPPEKSSYGYEKFRDDVIAVMDHLRIDKAHICGLSMGGYATLNVGMTYPQRALSLTMAGTGSGSERGVLEEFRKSSEATAAEYEMVGSEGVAKTYGMGPARIPFEMKDPRGYREFYDQFASHSARGAANTLRGYQGGRPPVYAFEDEIKKITLPTLTTPLLAMLVSPDVEKVAVPSGTVGVGPQFAPSVHSLVPPIQVPSTACAATMPSAVVASRVASE